MFNRRFPRQKDFLLKCKISLFRSWSDGKYLTWKIHQWPYYSDLGFHICMMAVQCTKQTVEYNSCVLRGKPLNWIFPLEDFVWCEYFEHVCQYLRIFLGNKIKLKQMSFDIFQIKIKYWLNIIENTSSCDRNVGEVLKGPFL